MKLFEFVPNETGYDSFFVMSETVENAIESLKKLPDGGAYMKFKEKYTINEYGEDEPTYSDNC
jgi:hypothetical protein